MYCYTTKTVRLACLNHAASVHSEPGSNSPKRVKNLVILELLNAVSRSSPSILCLELLIGGPNQSHKVNFKEPSHQGKRVRKNSFRSSVNTFSKNFFWKRSPRPACTALVLHCCQHFCGQMNRGSAEHVNCLAWFKSYF